ncbi:ornithine cyclodeaminase family protein [Bailinhaonella thermotolerans]|uniref:Ornithine cyclodeaminase family protein n=1 Tax=Bailinhaonella thermotolerans TaxID=1070861 RepID=A0A3A4BCM9_9ACTN|nr:ornithine cyclodeaminase family protein [Bailinhaonella thermotolerans]RJL31958.1 ornithine cyclodeaminase family protein [Bailinhaonella thermotolerans]
MTLLLGRAELERLLDLESCMEALERGFLAEPAEIEAQRVRTDLPGPGTATALIPGLVPGIPAYTVKVNAKFPGSRPALRGVVCLHDLATGELLAVMDSATITAWRTGLAAALATHALARPAAASRVAVIGAGAQSALVLRGLLARRRVTHLTVHDLDPARAESFAAGVRRSPGAGDIPEMSAEIAPTPVDAAREADIVILATWTRTPLLDEHDVKPGAHVTSLGADEPGKNELSPALLRRSRVFVDDIPLALAMGALGNAGLPAETAAGTLSQFLRGTVEARRSPGDTTVYAPVGLPWQDVALAWLAHSRARETGAGTPFDFLA